MNHAMIGDPDKTLVAKSPHAVGRVVEGEAVVVQPADGLVNIINAVGTRIWELIDGRLTVRDIAGRIAGEFDVSDEQAASDTAEFLWELKEKGLVVLARAEPAAGGKRP